MDELNERAWRELGYERLPTDAPDAWQSYPTYDKYEHWQLDNEYRRKRQTLEWAREGIRLVAPRPRGS
ncbi:hypothetical protein [Shinella sp.]|uniref:hypothetical protein n=1 Tax=Shinella sp. TaxID=1870904 RepID=UPI002585AD7F|nr:hypothetical protein [Shinella sp.]MCW5706095.1 hypothetical protein [Shinella sp.]